MKLLLVLVVALLSFAANAQIPSPQDGIGILPGTVASPGSAAGVHLWQATVDVGRVASRIDAVQTAAYTNATTTPSTILTVTLPIATWHCRGRVSGSDSTAADGVSVVLNTAGITASANSSGTGYVATTAPLISPIVVTATGGSETYAVATFATGFVYFDALLTVTVAGAVTVTGAQNAHTTGTLTINKGSYIICEAM